MSTRRIVYAVIALGLFVVEVYIAARLPHLNFVRGSLGDVLVVMLLYAFVLSFREFDRPRLAAATFLFACVIELCQYFHLAQVLGLKSRSILEITLGSVASWEDVLCYLVGAAVALVGDLAALSRLGLTARAASRSDP